MHSDPVQARRERGIRAVCCADSVAAAHDAYLQYRQDLKNCRFILAAEEGNAPGFAVNQSLSGKFVVRSIFADSNLFFIDEKTVAEMRAGPTQVAVDWSIGLDTQTVSYLEPYITGRAKVPTEFSDVFSYLARPDIDVNPTPYMMENFHRLSGGTAKDKERIRSKYIAYEVLRTLDRSHYMESNEIRSELGPEQLRKRVERLVAKLLKDRRAKSHGDNLLFMVRCFYALLLKMAIIQLSSPNRSTEDKLMEFLHFCDRSLATMWIRETITALHYFERGQKMNFFREVQKARTGTFEAIRGMAWDLWHIRRMDLEAASPPRAGARYFIPAFLTCDVALIELIDLCPMRAIAVGSTGRGPLPFYDEIGWSGTALGALELQHRIHDVFYTDEARASRHRRNAMARAKLGETVRALETELSSAANVDKPVVSM